MILRTRRRMNHPAYHPMNLRMNHPMNLRTYRRMNHLMNHLTGYLKNHPIDHRKIHHLGWTHHRPVSIYHRQGCHPREHRYSQSSNR
jgi:hypothetical protein